MFRVVVWKVDARGCESGKRDGKRQTAAKTSQVTCGLCKPFFSGSMSMYLTTCAI